MHYPLLLYRQIQFMKVKAGFLQIFLQMLNARWAKIIAIAIAVTYAQPGEIKIYPFHRLCNIGLILSSFMSDTQNHYMSEAPQKDFFP